MRHFVYPLGIVRVSVTLVRLVFFLLLSASASVRAATPIELRVGVYNNSPKLFVDTTGRAAGILIDMLDEMAAAEGWTVRYVPCTWAACVAKLARGELDVLPDVAYTEERARTFKFHAVPALLSWSQLYRAGNVKVIAGPLEQGFADAGPYDDIVVDGAIETVPDTLLSQLKEGGRLVAVVGYGRSAQAKVFTKTDGDVAARAAFDADVRPLPGFQKPKAFVF